MKKGLTYIKVILDRSGSMSRIREDMEGGLNQYVKEQQGLEGEALFGVVQFDGGNPYNVLVKTMPIKDVPKIKLIPRGNTPLLDCLGMTIVAVGEELNGMSEDEKPEKVLIMIITDGEENSSQEYDHEKVMKMLKHQEQKYNWEFMYLGANQNAIQEGAKFGMMGSKSMSYKAGKAGVTNMFASASKHSTLYRKVDDYSTSFDAMDRSSSMADDENNK